MVINDGELKVWFCLMVVRVGAGQGLVKVSFPKTLGLLQSSDVPTNKVHLVSEFPDLFLSVA